MRGSCSAARTRSMSRAVFAVVTYGRTSPPKVAHREASSRAYATFRSIEPSTVGYR